MWQYTGKHRPPFAEQPGPGQESVWDYPRPPALAECRALVEVGEPHRPIASSRRAFRVLETASPPTFYLPPDSIDWTQLAQAPGSSFCEWKGAATYWSLAGSGGDVVIGWSYESPAGAFDAIRGYVAFYPGRIPCFVDGEGVQPQPGGFYGGWITRNLAGPFKGPPGTGHW